MSSRNEKMIGLFQSRKKKCDVNYFGGANDDEIKYTSSDISENGKKSF